MRVTSIVLAGVLSFLPIALHAQETGKPISSDTAGYRLNRFYTYYPGTLRLATGVTIEGYMPVTTQYPGWDQPFGYYLTSPSTQPKPKMQIARVADVISMSVAGHYYETMRSAKEGKVKILAERWLQGPVELFIQAEPKSMPLPIPIAGAMIHTGVPFTNNLFYLRRDSELIKVSRNLFTKQMSTYLADYPDLVQKIGRFEKGYHYRDLVSIITEYNKFLTAKASSSSN